MSAQKKTTAPAPHKSNTRESTRKKTGSTKSKSAGQSPHRTAHKRSASARRHKRAPSRQALRIKRAFVASTELRPMAQQLATLRTPAAYAGVTNYARQHTGDAAGAAYLALGHAYLLDRRFDEAATSLHQARQASDALADYADFLAARALHEAGNETAAEALLHGFAQRYPDSIFNVEAPELEAGVLLAMNDVAGAQRALDAGEHTASVDRPGYQLARAQLALAKNQTAQANTYFKQVLLDHPLSPEAEKARAQLTVTGAGATLTASELRSLGDAYYGAGRYSLAAEQYNSLSRLPGLSDSEHQS
ncbi:MAG: tetratricopeptide repeat protein, partial [Terracidiphilus sp.]